MNLLQIYIIILTLLSFLSVKAKNPEIHFDSNISAWVIEPTTTTLRTMTFYEEMIPALMTSYFIMDEMLSHKKMQPILTGLHQKGTTLVIGSRHQVNIADIEIEYTEKIFETWKKDFCHMLPNTWCNMPTYYHERDTDLIQELLAKFQYIGAYAYKSNIYSFLDSIHYNGTYNRKLILLRSEIFDETAVRINNIPDENCYFAINAYMGILIHELAHAIHHEIFSYTDLDPHLFEHHQIDYFFNHSFQDRLKKIYKKIFNQESPHFTNNGQSLPYFLTNMYELFAESVAMYFSTIDLYDRNEKTANRHF